MHRPKYDDWTFPKGKVEKGETDEQAATREVREETGFDCALGEEFATVRYVDGRGRPKRVRYWMMTVVGGDANDPERRGRRPALALARRREHTAHLRTRSSPGPATRSDAMTIYLVRHAKAGDRSLWRQDDWLRPLSRAGRAQARGILELLSDARFDRVLSSPYVRCIETVAPIAGARRLAIEPDDALAEGGDLDAVFAMIGKHMGTGALLCSHGDVIPAVLESLRAGGVDIGPIRAARRAARGCSRPSAAARSPG